MDFEKGDHLFSRYGGKSFEKFINRISNLEMFDERLHGDPRAAENGRSTHDFGIAAYDRLLHR
jgi:hypothetical protein